jgi:hypothetical protein
MKELGKEIKYFSEKLHRLKYLRKETQVLNMRILGRFLIILFFLLFYNLTDSIGSDSVIYYGRFDIAERFLKKMPAHELLKLLSRSKEINAIELDSLLIVGDIIAEEFGLDSVYCSVSIRCSKILGQVNFSKVVFLKDVKLENIVFTGETNFTSTHFKSYASFTDSKFCKNVKFSRSIFDSTALFNDSEFEGKNIKWDEKGKPEVFGGPQYAGSEGFSGNPFYGYAIVGSGSLFNGIDFSGTSFNGEAWFNSTKFKTITWFIHTNF